MPTITYREAIRQAIDEEMENDKLILLMGEEVAQYNGAYKVSQGLLEKYGSQRVIDTPITEAGFTGIGIGAAMTGLRPIVEWMTFNFSLLALDQVINNAAKMRYMSGGQINVPIVFRGPNGPAEYLAAQHSQALEVMFTHIPGLKVVAPATPYDAKGLLKSAIRDNNPVVVLEGEMMYGWKGEVPTEEYLVPIGKADIKKTGTDISLITYGKPLKVVQEASTELENMGINAEILDLRSLRPLDTEAIVATVKKTHRAVLITESWPQNNIMTHVSHSIHTHCFTDLDAEIEIISSEDVPMPYNHDLELAAQPSVDKIITAVKKVLYIS